MVNEVKQMLLRFQCLKTVFLVLCILNIPLTLKWQSHSSSAFVTKLSMSQGLFHKKRFLEAINSTFHK